MMSYLSITSITATIRRVCYGQDSLLQLRVACALEQYWLVHRAYPDSIEALVPAIKLPLSVIGHVPMHYLRGGSGDFRLWSEGWNGTDEGGSFSPSRGDYENADWVWSALPGATPAPR
jgi:hypothetical protein